MTKHNDTLYIVSEMKSSLPGMMVRHGMPFVRDPAGLRPVGLIVTDTSQITHSGTGITMYLAFRDEGIFRSTDAGTQWDPFNEGLSGRRIRAVVEIGNAVFAGTNEGLYRLDTDRWEQVPVETFKSTQSLKLRRLLTQTAGSTASTHNGGSKCRCNSQCCPFPEGL